MFGDVVMGIEHFEFETLLEKHKNIAKVTLDNEIPVETLKNIIKDYKGLVKKFTGNDFPQDPVQQLILAIEAVFNS